MKRINCRVLVPVLLSLIIFLATNSFAQNKPPENKPENKQGKKIPSVSVLSESEESDSLGDSTEDSPSDLPEEEDSLEFAAEKNDYDYSDELNGEEPEPLFNKVKLSGGIEIEYSHGKNRYKDPEEDYRKIKENIDELVLGSAELGMDMRFHRFVRGFTLLSYEEGERAREDDVVMDEAYLVVGGVRETWGAYAKAGRYYPRFGEMISFLILDPQTVEIFELRETAAEFGLKSRYVDAGIGCFQGDVEKNFYDSGERVKGWFADLNVHTPEANSEEDSEELSIRIGASFINNIADSDNLEKEIEDLNEDEEINDISDYVPGFASYLTIRYHRFSFGTEYITALDHFQPEELTFSYDEYGRARKTKPRAWTVGISYLPMDNLELAVQYERTDDLYGMGPEFSIGEAVKWEMFDGCSLSVEHLYGEYDNYHEAVDHDFHRFTVQFAAGFQDVGLGLKLK